LRGGTLTQPRRESASMGLSPLARGNLPTCTVQTAAPGSIPACAGEPTRMRCAKPPTRVYPRLRGGTKRHVQRVNALEGLSPLARGNRARELGHKRARGSIPACAGEPAPIPPSKPPTGVYPRLRGGTSVHYHDPASAEGLSPLARGNQPGSGCCDARWRVYPRLRGGTTLIEGAVIGEWGLSPLARGNRPRWTSAAGSAGSIPACAGEPYTTSAPALRIGVYPRLRGGTRGRHSICTRTTGLSPLARGNLELAAGESSAVGSIPACAGEPWQDLHQRAKRGVYPRLRGGTVADAFGAWRGGGLSPLARGNPAIGTREVGVAGSIPACAGEPVEEVHSQIDTGVYPRLRGGTVGQAIAGAIRWGLSPLARGNPPACSPSTSTTGSIPACAGEPTPAPRFRAACRVYPRLRGGTVCGVMPA